MTEQYNQNQNQNQNQQLSPSQRKAQLGPFLLQAQRQIESLLSSDTVRAKQFMAASLVVAADTTLNKCEPDSIIQALVGVAMLDLSVDKNIGHVYLVPYGGKAQLQVGYKGMIQLLFRAGWAIKAFPVYDCDEFTMSFNGWDNLVDFTPDLDGRDEGDNEWAYDHLRGVYVVARHADTNDEYSAFVNKKVIEKLRLNSSNQKMSKYPKPGEKERLYQGLPIGIWQQWYIEMALGKGIKKLAKTLPIGDARAQMAIIADDKADIGRSVDFKASASDGIIIEMAEKEVSGSNTTGSAEPTIDSILEEISRITKKEQLDDILIELNKLPAAEKKVASAAWMKKGKELDATAAKQKTNDKTEPAKQQEQPIDWIRSIKECGDKTGLLNLISEMPAEVEMEHADLIDERMDGIR